MVKVLGLPKDDIVSRLRMGDVTICVVGLGYVGLPLATLFASEGARVIGCDINRNTVEKINRGESPIAEHDVMELIRSSAEQLDLICPRCAVQLFKSNNEVFCPHCQMVAEVEGQRIRLLSRNVSSDDLTPNKPRQLQTLIQKGRESGKLQATTETSRSVKESDAVLITVGTPIDDNHRPDTTALSAACAEIGKGLTKDTLIILKSTVSPGTTEDLVAPIISRESGLRAGDGFGLAHMPERIKEGMALYEFRHLPRIVAGVNKRSAESAAAIFSVFPAPIYIFPNPRVTETSKLFENIYRDVNISLVNELAIICQTLGIDVMQVIEAAQTDPKTHLLIPGPGVGGYCLTKDPYYLTHPAIQKGFTPSLIPTARKVNDEMPLRVAQMVEDALRDAGINVKGSSVTLLGLAFKGNSGDMRNTPVIPIAGYLKSRGVSLTAYDPLVDEEEVRHLFDNIHLARSLAEALRDAQCVVITADHIELRKLHIDDLIRQSNRLRAVVDTRHVLNPEEVIAKGLTYRGVGRGLVPDGVAKER